MGAVLAVESLAVAPVLLARLCTDTCVYGLALGLSLRGFFPGPLARILSRVPGGTRLGGWLRLSIGPAASAAP